MCCLNLIDHLPHERGQVVVTPTLSRVEAWASLIDYQGFDEAELLLFLRREARKLPLGKRSELAAWIMMDADQDGDI